MSELELANLVGSIYDAGSGSGDWFDVGDRLTEVLGGRPHISAIASDGSRVDLTRPGPAGFGSYAAYFHKIDPHIAAAGADAAKGALDISAAPVDQELINEGDCPRSEFYDDFAHPVGKRHLVCACVRGASGAIVSTFRDDGRERYERTDAERLNWLMPHFERAFQLRRQLPAPTPGDDLGLAALDALPIGIMLVDASMRILFVNAASTEILSGSNAALRATSAPGRLSSGEAQLAARNRQEGDALRKLVSSAASKQPGGALRLRGSDATASWAIVVSPAPARFTSLKPENAPNGQTDGIALIMMRNLEARHVPSLSLLSDLFNLSKAEAEVSALILGGAKAEDVARVRKVSLDTVRSQIRVVLGKTEAHNLRDFERIAASLPFLMPTESWAR